MAQTDSIPQTDSVPQADTMETEVPKTLPPDDGAIYGMTTPRATVSRHLHYLLAANYKPEYAADVIYGENFSREEKIKLATRIRDIFDAKGDYVHLDHIPDKPNYRDSINQLHRYIIFPDKYPDIYVEKYGAKWYYSKETIRKVDEIYTRIYPFGSGVFKKIAGPWSNNSFLGLRLWQYVGIILVIFISLVVYKIMDLTFAFIVRRIIPKIFPNSTVDTSLIPPLVHPFTLLVLTILLREYLVPVLFLPISLGNPIGMILKVALPVFGVLVFYRMVDVIASIFGNLAGKTETTLDDQLVPLLSKAGKLAVVVLGLIFILQNIGVNVTALLAGVSIGGLALALAAQDTVRNFIGSISIFVDRPFMIGDFIATDSFSGSVQEVGVRSTRLLAVDGAMISIPNGKLADMMVTNHGVRTFRRYRTSFTITYSTTTEQIEQFTAGIKEIAESHPDTQKNKTDVYFDTMADSSLNIYFSVFFDITDYSKFLAAKQEILMAIMKLAEKLGVDFAFPSTSLYVESLPEKEK